MEQAERSEKPITWLGVLLAVGPVVLSVGLAFGTTQFVQGETQESINTLKKQQEQMVTREELKIYIDATREDLREIKENIRAVRTDLARNLR